MSTKARTKFNPEQLHELERLYRFNSKPLKEMLIELGEQVGLELRTIQIWFQNRRMKDRHSNNNTGSSVAPSPATT
ncbi:homeobox-domain-containing protein, partial [Neoconidiobolus thromboides FSU 785]